MKDFKKFQEMDRRMRELAGLYAAERERADSLAEELRAIRNQKLATMYAAEKKRADALEAELRALRESQADIVNANFALSAPPRNCDVGTAEEQSKRFKKYCALNKDFECGCEKCPIFPYKIIKCEFIWSQLPYESEVKK